MTSPKLNPCLKGCKLRSFWLTKGMMARGQCKQSLQQGRPQWFRVVPQQHRGAGSMRFSTKTATQSKGSLARSNTSDASPPATINWPETIWASQTSSVHSNGVLECQHDLGLPAKKAPSIRWGLSQSTTGGKGAGRACDPQSPSFACTSSRSISPIGILLAGLSKSYLNCAKSR